MELHPLVAGFDGIAERYERGRPGYEAIAGALAELAGGPRLLDLGAGTGKLSAPLLALGRDVVAVEPLASMRAVLARRIGPGRVLAGTAEALPLPDASVDGALCADAWHWVDHERAAAELHRVVRPGGAVVLSWLHPEPDFPWTREIGAVLEPLRRAARHPNLDGAMTAGIAPPRFDSPELRGLRFSYETDRDGLLAYYGSISFLAGRADVLAELAAILDRHGAGAVRVPVRADLAVSRRRP